MHFDFDLTQCTTDRNRTACAMLPTATRGKMPIENSKYVSLVGLLSGEYHRPETILLIFS